MKTGHGDIIRLFNFCNLQRATPDLCHSGIFLFCHTYIPGQTVIWKELACWKKCLELKEELVLQDHQRPENGTHLVVTHPEFSIVGWEMLLCDCIDRTVITYFHLQNVSPPSMMEHLAPMAPQTSYLFLYENNSQIDFFSPSFPISSSFLACLGNASASWNGSWLLLSMAGFPLRCFEHPVS